MAVHRKWRLMEGKRQWWTKADRQNLEISRFYLNMKNKPRERGREFKEKERERKKKKREKVKKNKTRGL